MPETSRRAGVRPFEVDSSVMARIRPLRVGDVSRVAQMHARGMGQSLWGQLGTPFLDALYRGLLTDPDFLGFVYCEQGRVRGFIAGSRDTSAMLRRTFMRRGLSMLLPAVRGLLARPRVAPLLIETASYMRVSQGAGQPAVQAESLFCYFDRDLRGRRISGHINKVLFDALAFEGHERVKITTEVSNSAARRQLESWGFEDQGQFRFYGKEMVTFVLDLQASRRVEAIRWVEGIPAAMSD